MDFKDFKKNRSKLAENIEKIRDEKENKKDFGKDNYFPKLDELGNGFAVIRFLPQKDMAKLPVQVNYSHRAKIGNKNINLVCPSTFGSMKDCPLCQEAANEWAMRNKAGEEKPKVDAYRHKSEVVNILVVKDDSQPEMVGQVKKFYIPFPVLEKLNNKLMPPKNTDGTLKKPAEMVHDLWEGKNFNLEIKRDKRNYNDYSESCFESVSTPVGKTEAEIEAIFNQLFDLESDRSKIADDIVEKWNIFHAVNGSGTLADNKEALNEKVKEKEAEAVKEKEAEKKAEAEFSNSDVADSSNSADEEALPW